MPILHNAYLLLVVIALVFAVAALANTPRFGQLLAIAVLLLSIAALLLGATRP